MTSGNDYLLGLHGFPLVQSHLLLLLFPGSLGGENITPYVVTAGKVHLHKHHGFNQEERVIIQDVIRC